MYTPLIGRRLLDRANLRDGRDRSPAEFFDEVFFPLVFGHDQYLMTAAQNSPPDQLVSQRKKLKKKAEAEGRAWDLIERNRLRKEALSDLHDKASEVTKPFGNLVLGGYAKDITKTTTSQVTAIDHQATPDEVYLSWIGAATGAGVGGRPNCVLLIDHDEVLDAVLEGWMLYREVLETTPNLKANQLETWNGQWLRHRFSATYQPDDPTAFVHSVINTKKPPYNIETVSWARLLFSLGRTVGDDSVSAYVYSLGQMNATLGFVQLDLGATGVLRDSYATLHDFYRALFGDADFNLVTPDKLDEVYDAGLGFARACAQGVVGLRTLQPAKLYDFLPDGKNKQPRPVDPADAQTPLLYQTWIHAMLGDQKDTLLERATTTAEMLLDFETGALGGKTNLKKTVKEALAAKSLEGLLDGLTDIAETVGAPSKTSLSDDEKTETLNALDALVRETVDLSHERFRLFLALLRFQVALLRGKTTHAADSN